ncbi:MAG: family 43 glycosylhydrolase [Lachnospiraceae bacterium]|nr:family 43 glycosylhydrolase [Lachnospiraceae bacterium]
MGKFFRKALVFLLVVVIIYGSVPFNSYMAVHSMAAVKKTPGKNVPVPDIIVKPASKTLYIGWKEKKKSTSLKVTYKNVQKKSVSFKSSNKKVLKVSQKGKVTAVKAGKAYVTVTLKENKKASKKVKFTVKNYPMAFASKSVTVTLQGTSATTQENLVLYGTQKDVAYSSDNRDVLEVDNTGKIQAKMFGKAVVTAKTPDGKTAECTVKVVHPDMAVHDPSVYHDPVSGNYYTFGSHLMAAVSTDLKGYSVAASSGSNYASSSKLFTKKYTEEFAEAYAYTMPEGASQNLWAPDIIYNTDMEKYCMYVSVVDGNTKCCIAMASSDKPDGPYKYEGMIVCSGMNKDGSDVDKTNIAEALGITEVQAKESKYVKLGANSPDCIDATVFYDHNGKLWMVYGSFTTTGGIRLLKLDSKTGLRGSNYKDSGDGTDTTLSIDDPYYGKKIANSNGEGPYIQMVKNEKSSTGYYYYLWISAGNLQNYGGYNMRLMRAENPEGPYYDPKGNEAVKDIQKYALGMRVMDNYQFSFMDTAYVSQGGNSATDDGNGKTFIQFHTRTARSDSYTFRTHQTFVNEDGWLVTAPYEYNGESIKDSYSIQDVAGDYEFIYHRDTFAKTTTANMDYIQPVRITLNENGTVSGAVQGTWELSGHYFNININGKTYKGVVLEQYEQTVARNKTLVFTAAGNDNRAVWGSKMHKTDAASVKYDAGHIEVPETADSSFVLPAEGLFGSSILWSSDSGAVTFTATSGAVNASIIRGISSENVELTAIISKGNSSATSKFNILVKEAVLEISKVVQNDYIELPQEFNGKSIKWTSSDTDTITNDGRVSLPEQGYKSVIMEAETGGGKQKHEVIVLPATTTASGTVLYTEDYSNMVNDAMIATTWKSKDKQNCLYAESDAVHESFIKFAAGNTGSSQGANTDFGLQGKMIKDYTIEFDVALDAGTRDITEFAITGQDAAYKDNDTNAGIESGYILKLSADNSTTWQVNNTETACVLPLGWVHVKAIVNSSTNKAAVIISSKENIYFAGEVNINGTGEPGGLYLKWGCVQALVSVDNVKVTGAVNI